MLCPPRIDEIADSNEPAIINHTELCDCSLSAGFDYQINKAQITCPEDHEADEEFKTYFAYNQAVADVLNSTFDLDISQELAEFTKLSEDIPMYNLPTLNWFPIDQNEFENVMILELQLSKLV